MCPLGVLSGDLWGPASLLMAGIGWQQKAGRLVLGHSDSRVGEEGAHPDVGTLSSILKSLPLNPVSSIEPVKVWQPNSLLFFPLILWDRIEIFRKRAF